MVRYKTRPYKLICKVCNKEFENMQFHVKTCSDVCKRKLISISRKSSLKVKAFFQDPKYREKQRISHLGITSPHKMHSELILNKIKELTEKGFKCLDSDCLRPDIIATKDGKIYAYEIEFGTPNYKKYESIIFFDEVFWILNKQIRKTKKEKKV